MGQLVEVGEEHWYLLPEQWDPTRTVKWPSPTTFLGATRNEPWLRDWYGKEAAQYLIRNHDLTSYVVGTGWGEEMVKEAAAEPVRIRDAAAELGSLVHYVIECEILGQVYALTAKQKTLVGPYLDTIKRLVAELGLTTILAAESTVYNIWQQYAGTVDLVGPASIPLPLLSKSGELLRVVEPGEPGVWDWKTGTGSSIPKGGPQVVSYASATHLDPKDGGPLLRMEEVTGVPKVTWGALVHLAPPVYRVFLVDVTEAAREMVYLARQLFRVMRETPPQIIGMPTRAGAVHMDDLSFIDRRGRAELTIGGVKTLADIAALGRKGFTAYPWVGPATADKVEPFLKTMGLEWKRPEPPREREEKKEEAA